MAVVKKEEEEREPSIHRDVNIVGVIDKKPNNNLKEDPWMIDESDISSGSGSGSSRGQQQQQQQRSQKDIDVDKYSDQTYYSPRYSDETYEYRHVVLPKPLAAYLPKGLATEDEWRSVGIRQSPGWVHYAIHKPEPHILLFRRPIHLGKLYPPQDSSMQ